MDPSENKIYPLRPHHGMCLAFFVGEGYSDSFSEHMGEMLSVFEKGAKVRLTVCPDEICRACPNRVKLQTGKEESFSCLSEEKVSSYDRAVLEKTGFAEGEILPFREFALAVEEKIISSKAREEICRGCHWESLCAGIKSRWEKI